MNNSLSFSLLLIPLLPLIGAVVNGLGGKKFSRNTVSLIACVPTLFSFLLALYAFSFLLSPARSGLIPPINYFAWIQSGSFEANFGFQLDALTGVMLLVVTGIGFVIHIYSHGYMAHEGGYYRFFAYLNLFMFSMLVLVLANNFLLMFVGWEGVGLCSYLLIGFYFRKKKAADAGKKAFIVNRIGDLGFLLAMLLIFWTFGSLDFYQVFAVAHFQVTTGAVAAGGPLITAICILLFVGATGKSAQVPLYVWLPDAMEGPTPVSALIHAATMVTAGVYMVARCHPLFALAPAALQTVAIIGALTAILAASIGLVQTDIKKILAYSTISQLGFMFLGCGVGAFAAGIFHLMTHAFFKALLFLGAGSVIHALGGEQDIRKMGALKNKIPTTWWTMMAGTLAITGFFPFAGFFSKDEILWQTLIRGHWLLWVIGMIAAAMTSFYMFRMMFLTFHGKSRRANEAGHKVHESPSSMTVPLQILAIGSLVAGWVGIPQVFHLPNFLEDFLMPFFLQPGVTEVHRPAAGLEWLAMGLSWGVAVTGLLLAYGLYLQKPYLPEILSQTFRGLYATLLNKYWVDEFYNLVLIKPIFIGSKYLLWKFFDVLIVDGSVNGAGKLIYLFGNGIKRFQSGFIRTYAAWILLGSAGIIAYFFYVH